MRVNHITVGLFVVVGIALFAVGIFLIGSERKVFSKHLELYTKFANVTGVSKGTKVRVAGLDAGEVLEVSVPDYPSTRFRLKMQIDQRLHPTAPQATRGSAPKVGRNDPCPCGSGRKYKKCCGG